MASWPGSDKACPRCKLVGHDSRTCPKHQSKASKKRSSSSSKKPDTSSATLDTISPLQPISAAKDTPISDPTSDTIAPMDTEGYTPVVSNSQKRKQAKAAKQPSSSSSSAPPSNTDASSLPSFPFVLSARKVEELASLTEVEWMAMAQKAHQDFDDPGVNAFMELPPEEIIATFRSVIDYYQKHPIPPPTSK